jgi:AhpD family alkylhydroperoxidase
VAIQATLVLCRFEIACGFVRQSKLEPTLVELVKLRASQINGCPYCIDMHTKDARNEGETEQRLYALTSRRTRVPFSRMRSGM